MTRYRRYPVALSLLLSLLLSAGCEKATKPVRIGDAPELSGTDLNGVPVSLSRLRGKVVVLYFWSEACCTSGATEFEPFYRNHRAEGVEVLAVYEPLGGQEGSYSRHNAFSFPVINDDRGKLLKQYGALALPTVIIVDRTGVVRERILGGIPIKRVEQLAHSYLRRQGTES